MAFSIALGGSIYRTRWLYHPHRWLNLFAILKEDELISFVVALFEYSTELEEQVVALRRTVNELSNKERLPFPDLEGDIYQVFDDFSAYRKYQPLIEERIGWNKTHPISEIMKWL